MRKNQKEEEARTASTPPAQVPENPVPSGFYYRDGREMRLTHPDHGPMGDIPRQEHGSISAYYYCSKQEWADWGFDPEPLPRRHRQDG